MTMNTIDTIRRIIERSQIMTVPDQIEPLNRPSFQLGQYIELMRQIEEAINRPQTAEHCNCSDDSCPVWYEPSERWER